MSANPKLIAASGNAAAKYHLMVSVSSVISCCILNKLATKLSGIKNVASHVNRARFLLSASPRRESLIEITAATTEVRRSIRCWCSSIYERTNRKSGRSAVIGPSGVDDDR